MTEPLGGVGHEIDHLGVEHDWLEAGEGLDLGRAALCRSCLGQEVGEPLLGALEYAFVGVSPWPARR